MKLNHSRILAIALMLMASLTVSGNELIDITGKVVVRGGTGLGNCTVSLLSDRQITSVTDSSGYFRLKGMSQAGLETERIIIDSPGLPSRSFYLKATSGDMGSLFVGKPNILFIFADDLGYDGIGCFGNPYMKTPGIDQLVDHGMKFTQAYAHSQCTPARGKLLTGQYAARTHITKVPGDKYYPYAPVLSSKIHTNMSADFYTLAEMMRNAGYTTMGSGKWHLSGPGPEAAGFQFVGGAKPVEEDPKSPMRYTNAVLKFWKDHLDEPVFIYLAHQSPHSPLDAPQRYVDKWAEKGFPLDEGAMKQAGLTPEDTAPAKYLAMIDYFDDTVKLTLEEIERMGVADETLVIFTSDNGGRSAVWDHKGLRRGKGTIYEGGVKVPLLVRWPDVVRPGSVDKEVVNLIDYFPTFMEIAGGNTPEDYVLDGESMLPLFYQTGKLKRDASYMIHPHYVLHYNASPGAYIRQGDYKLILWFGDYLDEDRKLHIGEKVELFNIATDPGEESDLSNRPDLAEQVESMRARLDDWFKQTGAWLPVVSNPDYDPDSWNKAEGIADRADVYAGKQNMK